MLVGLAVLATACGTARSAPEPEPEPVSLSSAERTISLSVDGRERSYLLQPAQGLTEKDKAALIVVLHQEGGDPRGVATETALQDLRRQGATLAYPAGVDKSWDAGKCCGKPRAQGVDDVAFLDAVFADVRRQTPIDTDREALVGYSSGGMLTYRYVCGRSRNLAAAVVVSGSLESECSNAITVPDTLALHGKADGTIGFSQPIFIAELGLAPRPVVSSLGIVSKSAGCPEPQRTEGGAGVEVSRWLDCRGGRSIEALIVPDVGHGWVKLDATRRTRDFLVDHLWQG